MSENADWLSTFDQARGFWERIYAVLAARNDSADAATEADVATGYWWARFGRELEPPKLWRQE